MTKADPPISTYRDYGDTIITFKESAVAATVGGKPANGVIRFVNVWRRDGKVWRLQHRNAQFLP